MPRQSRRAGYLYRLRFVENDEIIDRGIVLQTHKAIGNLLVIFEETGHGLEHVVRVGVWLDDPTDFWSKGRRSLCRILF